MKALSAILFLVMMLCLPAQPALQTAEPVAEEERWEIVSDVFIGIRTDKLTPEERRAYGAALPKRQGLRIREVLPGSPAEQAHLQAGDLILLNNGAEIASMENLLLSVRNHRPGDLTHFGILREGRVLRVAVRLGALPEPVVVAYATARAGALPEPPALKAHQRRIACLLAEAEPNLQAVREEFATMNTLFPDHARPGHIRLYYETARGYMTVTAYADRITITLPRGREAEIHELRRQGDGLSESLRALLSPAAGTETAGRKPEDRQE